MPAGSPACLIAASGVFLTGGVATGAWAQTGPADGSWSFQLGAGTDNRSKDASKSDGRPFAWGGAEWSSGDNRLYGGPAFETIRSSTGSRLEVQVAAGFRPEFAGFELDFNAAHKWQVDADPGADDTAWEFTADVKRSIGPASGRLRVQHSPDGTGSSGSWIWIAGRVGWELSPRLQATAELGRREQDRSVDYTGWNAGVSLALSHAVELDLRWHDTDADRPGEQYARALVATASVAF